MTANMRAFMYGLEKVEFWLTNAFGDSSGLV